MKFSDKTNPLSIEMDASGVGLGVALLQTRNNTSCAKDEAPDNSKILTGAEKRDS